MFAVPPNTTVLPASSSAVHPALIAAEIARDRDRWAPLLRYTPEERYSALIQATAEVEIWLLSWLPGQHTDVHDHGGATGAYTVVSGVLTEQVRRQGREPMTHSVTVGQSRVFGPNYVHQVRNAGVDPAVSIHVYRPFRVNRRIG